MDSHEFPDIPGLGYPQVPRPSARRMPLQNSKADQQRERNRQAQRRHRESIKQRLEKYDRLRQSLQDPENDSKASEHLANLPSGQQQNLPSPSTSRIPSVPTLSVLSSLLSEVDVDQPKSSQPADPHDTLSRPCRGYANGFSSPLSTAQDVNSSSGSPQAEKHCSMTFPSSDTTFPLDSSFLSSPLEFETKTRAGGRWGSGRTLLHQGVVLDSEEIVLVLLAHVADMEARDFDGRTPLHLAAALGCVSIGRLLLMHGAATTVSLPDKHGLTPMHLAVQNGHAPMVEALAEFGAGVNLRF